MSIATADTQKAFSATWDASTLDATFEALYGSDVTAADHVVLEDQEAAPGRPFPYCVLDQAGTLVTDRMSGGANAQRHIRDTSLTLRVHARAVSGDSRTAKEIAAFLAEEIMKVFGGHPTVSPTGTLTLDNGNLLIVQYMNDFGIREGEDEYQWTIEYNLRADVPVMV